jgi:hypothetical protein
VLNRCDSRLSRALGAANSGRIELAWRTFVDAMPNQRSAVEYR